MKQWCDVFWKKYKNDVLLVLALLVLAGGCWLVLRLVRQTGARAVVTIDGETAAVLPLREDTVRVFSREGAENTVTVADGFVYVSEANCPNHDCIRQGKISRDGEMIVCLPHGLIVTVEGGAEAELDAAVR